MSFIVLLDGRHSSILRGIHHTNIQRDSDFLISKAL